MEETMTGAGTTWNASTGTLVTRLRGAVTLGEVRQWREGLAQTLDRLAGDTRFKLIVDVRDYEPEDMAAHKEMRVVIPLMLAEHGFRTALLDLFEPVDLSTRMTRGIACVAVAHVHHDSGKMEEYDARLGRDRERFFTDYEVAVSWIERLA